MTIQDIEFDAKCSGAQVTAALFVFFGKPVNDGRGI